MKNTITKKEMDIIRKFTPISLVGKQLSETIPYRNSMQIASYQKAGANWCYFVHVIYYNGELRRVVTMFGEILGA